MIDLSLVPVDKLLEEVGSRSESVVYACVYYKDGNAAPIFKAMHIGQTKDCVALAAVLQHKCAKHFYSENI